MLALLLVAALAADKKVVIATVKAVGEDSITVVTRPKTGAAEEIRLAVTDASAVFVDAKRAELATVKPGDDGVFTYVGETLVKAQVTSAGAKDRARKAKGNPPTANAAANPPKKAPQTFTDDGTAERKRQEQINARRDARSNRGEKMTEAECGAARTEDGPEGPSKSFSNAIKKTVYVYKWHYYQLPLEHFELTLAFIRDEINLDEPDGSVDFCAAIMTTKEGWHFTSDKQSTWLTVDGKDLAAARGRHNASADDIIRSESLTFTLSNDAIKAIAGAKTVSIHFGDLNILFAGKQLDSLKAVLAGLRR